MSSHRSASSIWALLVALAATAAPTDAAFASLVKSDGSLPLVMPNTLAIETEGDADSSSVPAKASAGSCAAAAIRLPHAGTRIVTARHCAKQHMLEVFDEQHHMVPLGAEDAAG